MRLTRRAALLGLTAAWSLGGPLGRASLALAAAPTDKRFVVVILRGALDGMAAVVPYGDPGLATWRAELIPGAPGTEDGMLDLGGFYGLHPGLAGLHTLYAAGELLPVHAVAGSYRSRSHFEAQDYLESGADHRMTSGWLNRVVSVLPVGEAGHSPGGPALAVGMAMPLLLRGPATVGSWAPQNFGTPAPDLYARLASLNEADPITGPAIREGLRERGFSTEVLSNTTVDPKQRYAFPSLAAAAGRMLAAADGPRIAALEIGGWDTHAGQAKRLNFPLQQLSTGLLALRVGLGDAWRSTAVLVMTEFGRTVRVNGTNGTDHGTGTIAFVLGGAVAGGRVMANWPGLAQANLFEDRDLQPTLDLRAVAKGLLAQHLGLPPPALARVFPDSDAASPARGLIRA
ncbi:MAG: DUF1501 domain-containing protein [Acidisphaera sp.]|nr:DUF1501 domain-containing protein [Acidisphaera sp.]